MLTPVLLALALGAAAIAWDAAGGPGALRDLYRRLAPTVMGVAMRLLRDRGEAEDVVQETFLALWRRAGEFDERRASLSTWAVVIARSRALDRLRARSSARRARDASGDEPAPAPLAHEQVEARQDRERVHAAMAELPREQRAAVELAFFEGLTHGEIAARLEQPLGTVKTRIRLAMEKLHARLVPLEPAS